MASQLSAVGNQQATQPLKDNYTSYFTYNTMGRLIKKENPLVNWTNATGVVAQGRPTEYLYYDQSGRMVASKDANGNLTSRTYLAGTGYGEGEGAGHGRISCRRRHRANLLRRVRRCPDPAQRAQPGRDPHL